MFKILNRLAWIASFAFGFFVFFIIASSLGMLGRYGILYGSSFWSWLIPTTLLASLFKKTFLGKKWIIALLQNEKIPPEKMPATAKNKVNAEDQTACEEKTGTISSPGAFKGVVEEERDSSQEIKGIFDMLKNAKEDYKTKTGNIKKELLKEPSPALKVEGKVEDKKIVTKPIKENFFHKFFKENVLAKIGGILLFLAVLFLLQLVYTRIGPIGKLLVGFFIGFLVFAIGLYLEKKKYQKESRVMFGTAILINYLVIVSGRYLIGGGILAGENILSEAMTFFLLILNTIFAVSTSLAFKSQTLLFFSFAAAYINPFLVGDKTQSEPYTFVFYALILSAGAMFLSIFHKKENAGSSKALLTTALIGGNILILSAPFTTEFTWIFKLAAMGVLSLASIFTAYKNEQQGLIGKYFIILYAFYIALIFQGSLLLENAFSGLFLATACLITLLAILLVGVFSITFVSTSGLFLSFLLFPLLLVFFLFDIGIFSMMGLGSILLGTLLVYLLIFIFIFKNLSAIMSYVFFATLGIFIFLISGFLNINELLGASENISAGAKLDNWVYNFQAYSVMLTGFIFLGSAYYFSGKKRLEYLYSMATIIGIFALLPVLTRNGDLRTASITSITLLFLANVFLPFVHKNLLQSKIQNIILGIAGGALFAIGELFYFWYGDMNQSKITLGLSFAGLAALYFLLSYLISLRVKKTKTSENAAIAYEGEEKKERSLDVVYAFLGISISIFSLAIAYIFSTRSEIVASIWIFEAVLMFFFYKRTRELKIYLFGIILGILGLLRFSELGSLVKSGDYYFLIPLAIIILFLAAALKFLSFEKRIIRLAHDILHIGILFGVFNVLLDIIPNHRYGWDFLGTAIFILCLSFLYGRFYSGKIKYFFILFASFAFLGHIGEIKSIFYQLDRNGLSLLKAIQILSTVIFVASIFLLNYLSKKYSTWKEKSSLKTILNTVASLYLFIISSLYIFYFFAENSFVVTIYWGLLSLFFLSYGIEKNFIKFRTIGLYILSLTTLKILVYDIWSGLDNAIMRVIALMVIGGIMIGISVFYSKKYGGNLKGEFELKNLK